MDCQKSDSENSDSDSEFDSDLMISKADSDRNYDLAGTLVDEPEDEISISKHEHLLSDTVHLLILEILEETGISFKLSDFQMLSLHVLGNLNNLILISPTGSGKMLGGQLLRTFVKFTVFIRKMYIKLIVLK